MTYEMIRDEWNNKADQYNQWENTSTDEKVEFAYELGYNNAKDDSEKKI